MINIAIFVAYFIFTCLGMVLIKLGGRPSENILFTLPVVDFRVTALTFIGFFVYGLSFLLYTILLTRYELSFLNPVTIGITSILIFASAALVFGEAITLAKIAALLLIVGGVIIINVFK